MAVGNYCMYKLNLISRNKKNRTSKDVKLILQGACDFLGTEFQDFSRTFKDYFHDIPGLYFVPEEDFATFLYILLNFRSLKEGYTLKLKQNVSSSIEHPTLFSALL